MNLTRLRKYKKFPLVSRNGQNQPNRFANIFDVFERFEVKLDTNQQSADRTVGAIGPVCLALTY